MPWKVVSAMTSRLEFVQLASLPGANLSKLCRRFSISRPTAYKWLARFEDNSPDSLVDRSRKPLSSPSLCGSDIQQRIVAIRTEHPAWGPRKIRRILQNSHLASPAASTICSVLKRHNLIDPLVAAKHTPFVRFERPEPNQLWQMDFKGHFALGNHLRCHPLTVLDDHSRFNLVLQACPNQQSATVQDKLSAAFRLYGLPDQMLMDNGSPWSGDLERPDTPLTIWLMRLHIAVSHGRAYHPQTQGKEERFHRTLKEELLASRTYDDHAHCQQAFDPWREIYNCQRPHEAIGLDFPVSRYKPSLRPFPDSLPPLDYPSGDFVRKVQQQGFFSFKGKEMKISQAFYRCQIALRPAQTDGFYEIRFAHFRIAYCDLRDGSIHRSLPQLPN